MKTLSDYVSEIESFYRIIMNDEDWLDEDHYVYFNNNDIMLIHTPFKKEEWHINPFHISQIVFSEYNWTLVSRSPLTVKPSILCSCGDHGYITEGKWIKV